MRRTSRELKPQGWSVRPLAAVALGGLACALLVACGGTHLRLTNRGTSEGPLYVCDASSCETAQTDDPERINHEGTVLVELPPACPEMSGVTLHRETPSVVVTCGPQGATKQYRCTGEGGCVEGASEESAGMPIAMPADCGGRIHEVLVQRADEEQPTTYVQCDTSGGGIVGDM